MSTKAPEPPADRAQSISIRRLTESDAPDAAPRLTEIALAAKSHWDYPEAWIREWAPLLTFDAQSIIDHATWAAFVDEQIVGFTVLQEEEGSEAEGSQKIVGLEHMWISPSHHGFGLGRKLFDRLKAHAEGMGADVLEVVSDPYAEGFYQRMGFKHHGLLDAPVAGQDRQLPVLRMSITVEARPSGTD